MAYLQQENNIFIRAECLIGEAYLDLKGFLALSKNLINQIKILQTEIICKPEINILQIPQNIFEYTKELKNTPRKKS